MVNHPTRNKLEAYGGRIIDTDGRKTVEIRDVNDNAKRRFQYRRSGATEGHAALQGVERRILQSNGKPFRDGSLWEPMTEDEIAQLRSVRGEYHPILDPLGL